MRREQIYASRKDFIENGVGQMMAAKKDFESIQYAFYQDHEYVRIRDIFGKAVTLEITNNELEKILSDMCRIIIMAEEKVSVPTGIITDKEVLRNVSPLFKTA